MAASNVAIIVATYGDKEYWSPLAHRALDSARNQTDHIIWLHEEDGSLAHARNMAVNQVPKDVQWLIFLDADDELDPGYVQAMLKGTGDLRQPSTLGVYGDGTTDDYPVLIPKKHLLSGNYIVIGAMVNRSLFAETGGFRDLPAFEDWDLWLQIMLAGGEITACPDAIYKVHVRENSRNQANDDLFHQIQDYWIPIFHSRGLA